MGTSDDKSAKITAAVSPEVPQYVIDHGENVLQTLQEANTSIKETGIVYKKWRQNDRIFERLPISHKISSKDVAFPDNPLALSNLDQLNAVGSNNGSDLYLTSTVDITTNPQWLRGIDPEENGSGADVEEKSSVIIVVDKGNGTVDAFYMYFYAFNWGGVVLEKQLGDHVGDWEHNMIRFINGTPKYVWYSQHSNGEAFSFSALKKDKSGKRPIAFSANGSHALYATPGTHDHTLPNLNLNFRLLLVDDTDAGPTYDPIPNSYFFAYTPTTSTFTPASPTPSAPAGFLSFTGHWGDAEYPTSDPRQTDLLGNKKFVGGPTGPRDKGLDRKNVWPESSFSGGQGIRRSLDEGLVGWLSEWMGGLNCFGKKQQKKKVVVKVNVKGEEVD